MPPLAYKMRDIDANTKPGPGTISNRATGAELHGELSHPSLVGGRFLFAIDGTTEGNTFTHKDWTFTPDPEPVKDGYYLRDGMIYRILGDKVTVTNLGLVGDSVTTSIHSPRTIAENGTFLGDLEGNR